MPLDRMMERDIALVEQALEQYLPATAEPYSAVAEAARYSLLAGGKRLRPVMLLELCRMYGGNERAALPFACAVEMIHVYSLIHDDLPCMDDDDFRRGKPSCHRAFGEATALLAGDALLTRAFEVMAQAEAPAERALRAIGYIAAHCGINGMIGGQVIDLALENQREVSPQIHRLMASLKTAALIKSACAAGGILAGCGRLDALERFAEGFGMAFQITDDILDVTGRQEILGKPVGSDAKQGKTTFVSVYGVQQSREMTCEYLAQAREALDEMPKSLLLSELCDFVSRRVR